MLPYINTNVKTQENIIRKFWGINKRENISEGELLCSENLSSEEFPALKTRRERCVVEKTNRIINGFSSFESYFYTSYSPDDQRLFLTFDGSEYEFTSYSESSPEITREFACLSDSILIIPDNIIFYVNSREFSRICFSNAQSASTARSKFKRETNDSDLLNNASVRYLASYNHNSISFRYTNYSLQDEDRVFYYGSFDEILKAGDIVTIKMTTFSDSAEEDEAYRDYVDKMKEGISAKIKEVTSVTHNVYDSVEQTETVELIFDDNTIDTGGYKNLRISRITMERGMPVLDKICSHNNRIWAISGNEIYTSKLGNPSEWNDFSTDAYGIMPNACFNTKAETRGDFTGIIPYNSYIFAFKENAIHKVYGDCPAEYTLYTKLCIGTQKNLGSCICTAKNYIIYPCDGDIYVYGDDYPVCISHKLKTYISPISACCDRDYYYVLATQEEKKKIFVYDLKHKSWHTQDSPGDALFLASSKNEVYMATSDSIIHLNPKSDIRKCSDKIRWSFTIRFDDRLFDMKGYKNLAIRYSLASDASFTVRAKYDDSTSGAVCGAVFDESHAGGCMIYLPIRRCLWFDLEFCGTGQFSLKALKLKYYRGSEV